eukprot:IDg526t1
MHHEGIMSARWIVWRSWIYDLRVPRPSATGGRRRQENGSGFVVNFMARPVAAGRLLQRT